MSKSLYGKNKLFLFLQYESEHVMLILACDYQTRTCIELTFTPTVIFASFYV